ncbi:MAG: TetR family transcriptional regulator C-terminal domain-containing protein [Rhizobiales bacterium]|nr:TetR family transcriptional regulator C-terminal domain-containing protein [Hyphomicrobiales bacterium]
MTDTDDRDRSQAATRTASRDVRRQQLIEATIAILARKGYSALTVADVAKAAGLSVGIIGFHFDSKEGLLAACLHALAEEYRRTWRRAVATAGPAPARQLRAMLLSDFDMNVFTPEKLAAWIAFWGETQGRPTYDAICADFDRERLEATASLCATLIKEEGSVVDAALAARTLDALCDGLWYGLVSAASRNAASAGVAEARKAVDLALAAFFPKHFKATS